MQAIRFSGGFPNWQVQARDALRQGRRPEDVLWEESADAQGSLDLFARAQPPAAAEGPRFRVPKSFLEAARFAALHSSSDKWALLYRMLWRLTHGEPHLMDDPTDPDFIQLRDFAAGVHKDAYRMVAFLRFREVRVEDGPWFIAWYEPEYDTLECNAKFFVDRYANMRWSILTPKRCMHWNGSAISFSEGVAKSAAPSQDELEALWIRYYSAIFNPARLKIGAMQAQLLKRNWKNLPEAVVIDALIREAPRRADAMIAASDFKWERESEYNGVRLPEARDYASLRDAAAACRGCPLWKTATCTVFGEGPEAAKIVLVGEQPGDQEDQVGRPFVGPAGQVLNRALAAAGVSRSQLYVTNAVKHFKFEPRGKRRIHKTVGAREIAACRPWLEAELQLIQPRLIVALGATAARSLFRTPVRVGEERGRFRNTTFGKVLVTIHPSALLRLPDGVDADEEFGRFVTDLKQIPSALAA